MAATFNIVRCIKNVEEIDSFTYSGGTGKRYALDIETSQLVRGIQSAPMSLTVEVTTYNFQNQSLTKAKKNTAHRLQRARVGSRPAAHRCCRQHTGTHKPRANWRRRSRACSRNFCSNKVVTHALHREPRRICPNGSRCRRCRHQHQP